MKFLKEEDINSKTVPPKLPAKPKTYNEQEKQDELKKTDDKIQELSEQLSKLYVEKNKHKSETKGAGRSEAFKKSQEELNKLYDAKKDWINQKKV